MDNATGTSVMIKTGCLFSHLDKRPKGQFYFAVTGHEKVYLVHTTKPKILP